MIGTDVYAIIAAHPMDVEGSRVNLHLLRRFRARLTPEAKAALERLERLAERQAAAP